MDNQEEANQNQEINERTIDLYLDLAIRCHEIERSRKQGLESKVGIVIAVLSAGFFIFSNAEYSFNIIEIFKKTDTFVNFLKILISGSIQVIFLVSLYLLSEILKTTNYDSLEITLLKESHFTEDTIETKKFLISQYARIQKSADEIRAKKNKKFDLVIKLLLVIVFLVIFHNILW